MIAVRIEGGEAQVVPLVTASRMLRLTYQQAYGRLLSGVLPGERIDGRWYVKASVLRRLLDIQANDAQGRDPNDRRNT